MKGSKPKLLLIEDLIEPIEGAINELNSISSKKDLHSKEDFILKGTFVYIVSLFESSITECLKRYLIAFPEKISEGKLTGKENEYLSDSIFASDLIEYIVDDFIQELSYKSVSEMMNRTFTLLGIDSKKIKFNNNELVEKKERRNILVHNDLRIDKKYIRNTKCAHNRIRLKLVINGKYIAETIELVQGILETLRDELLSIYSGYNRSLLLKTIWNYVFDSPLLIYDDYWNKADSFIFQNNKKFNISDLSSGEKTMLAYWLQHYSSDIVDRYFTFKDMSMSTYRTKKMNFLVEFFNKYPLILQHG